MDVTIFVTWLLYGFLTMIHFKFKSDISLLELKAEWFFVWLMFMFELSFKLVK